MTATTLQLRAPASGPAPSSDRHGFTALDAREMWRSKFAAWVQALNLVVEDCSPDGVRLRLPYARDLARFGGTICGQALMACADSAMAMAIMASLGEFRNATTVTQTITFMRAIADRDVTVHARVKRSGRTLVFAEAWFTEADAEAIAVHASSTWALIA